MKKLILLTFAIIIACSQSNTLKPKIIGTYNLIMDGKPSKYLTLTLKENGTGYFKNTEFVKYAGEEYCTFDYDIREKQYKIKNGSYQFVNLMNRSGNAGLCQMIQGVFKIFDKNNNKIDLKWVLTNEKTEQKMYFRK